MHKLTHNLKRVGDSYGVPVIFSAPSKFSGVTASINRKCLNSIHYDNVPSASFVACREEVIYEIFFFCGRLYVGETGRYINDT